MGLFDRFKKKHEEPEKLDTTGVNESEHTETEETEVKETAEATLPPDEELSAKEPEVIESASSDADNQKVIQLNQQLAQGIFNESIALYQSLPADERQSELHGSLVTLTNDPLSQTFLEASELGMVTAERVANNIQKADEKTCRLALVQLASEGENQPKEKRALLGQTQTALFLRILELNQSAGTSESAKPAEPKIPEGETPAAFFQLEIAVKAAEKKLNEAQQAVSEKNISRNQLKEALTKDKSEEEQKALLESNEEYQKLLAEEAELREKFNLQRTEYLTLADRLAKEILNLPHLYAAVDSMIRPEMPWISNNGHTEFYTSKTVAAQVEASFKQQGINNMAIRELKNEEIRAYMERAQHLGIVHFLIDNGRTPIDLRLNRVTDFEEKTLVEYANRAVRFAFLRAKGYGLQYAALGNEKQEEEEGLNIRDRLLTMLFNAYREMGMGISYTLMQSEHEDNVSWYSQKAFEIAKNLQNGVFKNRELAFPGDETAKAYTAPLSLALIRRGKASDPESLQNAPALVPVFSDVSSARTLQGKLALQGAVYEVVAITWDELLECSEDRPGLVYDPEMYGLFIPKEDFEKVEQFRRVRGSIVIDHHKNNK